MALDNETTTKVWKALKDYFIETVQDTFYGETELLSRIERNKKGVSGRQIILKYKKHGNQGIGNVVERGTLPTGGNREYEEGTVSLKNFYAVVDVSGQEINGIDSKGAFIDLIGDAFIDTAENARLDINRQLWGDGTGAIGTVASGGVSGNVLTLNAGHALHFFKGMECEFYSAGGVKRTGTYSDAKVVAINVDDIAAMTVTFDQMPTTVVATDSIYRAGNYSATQVEFTGFKKHFMKTGTYQGLNRATAGNEFVQALVSTGGGTPRNFSGLILQKAFAKSKMLSGAYPKNLFTSNGIRNSYVLYLETNNQPVEQIVSKSGFAAELKFFYGGTPITMTVMDDAPRTDMYLFNPDKFEWRESAGLQWENGNGGKLTVAETTDRSWGRMFMYADLVNTQPNSMHLVSEIKADT